MDAKEYLQQIRRLDLRINSHVKERKELMELASNLSSPQFRDKVMNSSDGDPQFLKRLERVWDLDKKLSDEIDLLVDLRLQVYSVLECLENSNHQLVLRYRYVNGYTLEEIAEMMGSGQRSVYRWHKDGLAQIKLPKNPIVI